MEDFIKNINWASLTKKSDLSMLIEAVNPDFIVKTNIRELWAVGYKPKYGNPEYYLEIKWSGNPSYMSFLDDLRFYGAPAKLLHSNIYHVETVEEMIAHCQRECFKEFKSRSCKISRIKSKLQEMNLWFI